MVSSIGGAQVQRDPTWLRVTQTWDGAPVPESSWVTVACAAGPDGDLEITVESPFYDDPPPAVPPGPTDGLWNYEVVELFLLGREGRYLELELGPRGHHWGLVLRGRRRVERAGIPVEYRAEISRTRWSGTAVVRAGDLPAGLDRANAYAIHGVGLARRYLAAHPVPGPAPDFHRLDRFGAWRAPEGLRTSGSGPA